MADYTIKFGDTLSKIASDNGSTVEALAKFNGISDPNKISAGSTLKIPGAVPPPPQAPTPVPGEQTQAQREAAFAAAGTRPVITPAPSAAPMTTSDLSRATQLPDASAYASTAQRPSLSDTVAKVASTTLDSTGQAIDGLLAQREEQQKAQKDTEAAKVAGVEGDITSLGQRESTATQDALAATRAKFNVDQSIADLQSIQTKISAAQEALNLGLIYEENRPAREQLVLGRTDSLRKQGLATIGALQSSAQIIQGNLDLADSYAKTTISAIMTDNKNAMDSLNVLLALHNDNLVTLTKDEKTTLDSRIAALQDQDKQLQQNSNDVFDLMSKYPSAAIAGGVTLLDDRSTAIAKMLPKLSAMEMQKFNADIAAKAKSTGNDSDGPAADKQQLLALKASGMTFQEALNAFSDTLSVDWISSVYREADPKSVTAEDQLKNSYYGSFLDQNGNVKSGYTVSVDSKGNPVVDKTSTGGAWWNPANWF